MNAELDNQHECQCELCKPNWHLGQDDNYFERQPAEQRQVTLEESHVRKVTKQAFEFAEATG